jgi:hypothetical protein
MHQNDHEDLCHHLLVEQDDIDREIECWRAWWKELREMGLPKLGEMSARVANIRNHLHEHFAHEEATGLLSDVADGDRELKKRATALLAEHQQLLAQLQDLVDKMSACGADQLCWGGAGQEFEAFLDRLAKHEQEESLVLRAVTKGSVQTQY